MAAVHEVDTVHSRSFTRGHRAHTRVARCAREERVVDPDEELEMLVILRMNRKFMLVMREHYNQLTTDHFGRTTRRCGRRTVKSFTRIMKCS